MTDKEREQEINEKVNKSMAKIAICFFGGTLLLFLTAVGITEGSRNVVLWIVILLVGAWLVTKSDM